MRCGAPSPHKRHWQQQQQQQSECLESLCLATCCSAGSVAHACKAFVQTDVLRRRGDADGNQNTVRRKASRVVVEVLVRSQSGRDGCCVDPQRTSHSLRTYKHLIESLHRYWRRSIHSEAHNHPPQGSPHLPSTRSSPSRLSHRVSMNTVTRERSALAGHFKQLKRTEVQALCKVRCSTAMT